MAPAGYVSNCAPVYLRMHPSQAAISNPVMGAGFSSSLTPRFNLSMACELEQKLTVSELMAAHPSAMRTAVSQKPGCTITI